MIGNDCTVNKTKGIWLMHTAQDRDRDQGRWVSILRYVLCTVHRDRDRDREALFSIGHGPVPVPVLLPCTVYEPIHSMDINATFGCI